MQVVLSPAQINLGRDIFDGPEWNCRVISLQDCDAPPHVVEPWGLLNFGENS